MKKNSVSRIEIPLGKRSTLYRFFEIIPAVLSYGAIILLIMLAYFFPFLAAIYVLLIVVSMFVKAVMVVVHMVGGRRMMERAKNTDWSARLAQLENPKRSLKTLNEIRLLDEYEGAIHADNITYMAEHSAVFPKPSEVKNAVIIAIYNESREVIEPTIQSLINTTYDKNAMLLFLAYEERGGSETEKTVRALQEQYRDQFAAFEIVKHPSNVPNEVVGKGGNITFAGRHLAEYCTKNTIDTDLVLVTTLDSDNRPHPTYFDYVTYEFIVREDRQNLSYQPVSIFINNIWDVPAPMRVVAMNNSFFNILNTMRPHALRNFASHTQPLKPLIDMDFWSVRTIVEDGHQYWRSYFFFKGKYEVVSINVPIYQDAVLSDKYIKTLRAQFMQLRRWAYGASDIPYVAVQLFRKNRLARFWPTFARFARLVDGHVTWAMIPIIVTFGGFIPLYVNTDAAKSVVLHQLPDVISLIQTVAMAGIIVMIFTSFKLLPKRPARHKPHRSIFMFLQWILLPICSVAYSSFSAYYAQTRLAFGYYLDKFDVTEKATHQSVARAKKK